MIQIFSSNNSRFLNPIGKSEAELNSFLSNNWTDFFPQFIFIKSEFSLDGSVRSKGTSGRIDILALNSKTKKFVVIELKRDLDKNIRNQASDYKDFIEDNFADVYLLATQSYNIELPKHKDIIKDNIELVLIAQNFSDADIEKAKKSKGEITLIKYKWFENDLLLIHYLNNEPLELIPKGNNEKYKGKTENIIHPLHPTQIVLEKNGAKFKLKNNNGALAYGILQSGKFMVLEGSIISSKTAPNFQTSSPKDFKLRNNLNENEVIVNRRFMRNYEFNSKSEAAKVITGGSINGQTAWQPQD